MIHYYNLMSTFNSLYEIPHFFIIRISQKYIPLLSILFMRFKLNFVSINKHTKNLSILFMRFIEDYWDVIVTRKNFQFSLWDSLLILGGLGLLSYYFQFSLWDSWKGILNGARILLNLSILFMRFSILITTFTTT